MVADDQRKIASQLASALPVEEVDQAVVVFRDKNRHPGTAAAECDAPVHAECVGDRAEGGIELFQIELEPAQIPFHSGVIETLLTRRMLFEVEYVSVMPVEEFGDSCIQAFAVRALHQ